MHMLKHKNILLQKDRKDEMVFGMQCLKSISVSEVCNISQNFFCGKDLQHAALLTFYVVQLTDTDTPAIPPSVFLLYAK